MRGQVRRFVIGVGGTALAVFALAGGTGAAAAAPAVTSTTVLANDVFPGLTGLSSTPTAPTTDVQIGVTFSDPAAVAAQRAMYQAIYTPGNALYHHFMTPSQVASAFGVPSADFIAATTWLTRAGLHAVYASQPRTYLLLDGTAAQAEQTFSVTLRDYTYKGTHFYANSDAPTVPADLDVTGVIGLNNLLRSHTMQNTCASSVCTGLTTPEDLWSVYGQPTELSNTSLDFGQGQQMAVLGEGSVSGPLSDLRAFENEFGLPHIPITIQSINDDFQDTSGGVEWDIDSQASTGMSPKAYGETWIFGKDLSDPSVLAIIQAFQGDANIMQANASFGECEEDPTSPVTGGGIGTGLGGLAGTASATFIDGSETALQQATIEGKTLFSSTGDTGSSCPVVAAAVIGAGNGVANQFNPETNYPASSPFVTAVGGTVLYTNANTATAPASNATRDLEYSWNYTGGGTTFYIKEPSYQVGIAPVDNVLDCIPSVNTTISACTTPGAPTRGIPDVAAQSGDILTNGYAITAGGVSDSAGGGTSLASPLWMGMWTRIQAATHEQINGVYTNGFANPALYTIGKDTTKDPLDFFDLGAPPNSVINSNGYYANLTRSTLDPSGWDYLSGLGAPNVTHLGEDITGNSTLAPTNDIAAPAAQDCGQPGLVSCTTSGGTTCSGIGPLWSNPPHTASDFGTGNPNPSLTLDAGAMSTSTDGKTLRVLLTVENLSNTVPTGVSEEDWYMLWTYNGTVYFANAQLDAFPPGSAPTFHDGTVTVTGTTHNYNTNNTDTGHFTLGPNGVVEIDVPLANVGKPPVGSILLAPSGETDELVGAAGTGFIEKVDTGGPDCNYAIGSEPTALPEAPLGVTLPAAGLITAGMVAFMRRRRTRTV